MKYNSIAKNVFGCVWTSYNLITGHTVNLKLSGIDSSTSHLVYFVG